jgi:LmeA-like phospholipid-binding
MSYEPTQPLPGGWQGNQSPAPTQVYPAMGARRRRKRWPLITGIVLVVVLVLLVVADRVANAIAENTMASQVQQQGFPVKPNVTIEGFPFFTQLLAHDFNTVDINASNVPEGPLTISSLKATLHGMHVNGSFSSATIDTIDGSALITFGELASAGGVGQGITLSPDPGNPNEINANIDLGVVNTTLTAKVTRVNASEFNVSLVSAGDVPASLLGNLVNFNVSVPKLPAGVKIDNVTVTSQGVLVTITGHNTTLSQ